MLFLLHLAAMPHKMGRWNTTLQEILYIDTPCVSKRHLFVFSFNQIHYFGKTIITSITSTFGACQRRYIIRVVVLLILVFSFLITAIFRLFFLSIVWSEQNKQATIFPRQLCQSLSQTFLIFTVVQNPCRPQSKAMPNPRFDGNATIR